MGIIDFSSCVFEPPELLIEKTINKTSNDLINLLNLETFRVEEPQVSTHFLENELRIQNGVIEGVYISDLNLLYIDSYLTKYLSESSERIQEIRMKYTLTQDRLTNVEMNVIEYRRCLRQLESLQKELAEQERNIPLQSYREESQELLDEYRKLGNISGEIFLETEEDEDISRLRKTIVKLYLDVVKKFHRVNIRFLNRMEEGCLHCHGNSFFTNSDFMKECSGCGYVVATCSNEDDDIITKKYYITEGNDVEKAIQKKLDKIQGKTDTSFPENLFDLLDEYFSKIGFAIGKEVKEWPLDSCGMSINQDLRTSVPMLRKALREIGHAKYYDEVYRIGHEYWGWQLHDLSHLEELIKITYIETIAFIQDKKEDRTSDCNSEYWFYRVLEQTYRKLSPLYFNIIKTEKTLDYHENLWSEVCRNFGWDPPVSL